MKNWGNFYKKGLEKENEFSELLITNEGGITKHASRKDDIVEHIDIIWTVNDHNFTFDVKSLKKNNRIDSKVDDSIHWIEIQNVQGNLGWLYGKADYIAFETLNSWVVLRRKDIITLINYKVKNDSITSSKELYTYYQRKGRKDIIVKVLTSDLQLIARKIYNKNTLV